MAKTVKKAAAKRKPAKKATAKSPIAKAKAKPKREKPVLNTKAHNQPDNFMTRLLKKKEAERITHNQEGKNSNFAMHSSNPQLPTGKQGFGRFHGPRRKAM